MVRVSSYAHSRRPGWSSRFSVAPIKLKLELQLGTRNKLKLGLQLGTRNKLKLGLQLSGPRPALLAYFRFVLSTVI